jgi:hypothetical protein
MSLGVHFALVEKDARRMQRARGNDALQEVLEEIEERWDRRWLQETDKAWDAIHRCLTDGYLRSGSTPSTASSTRSGTCGTATTTTSSHS